MARYISALGMHFKRFQIANCKLQISKIIYFAFCIFYFAFCTRGAGAEVIDRVMAYVDDSAITLSEFRDNYARMKETMKTMTEEEAINSMINRQLLLKEAKKMRLEAPTKDDLLKDYVDIKIRASIVISERDVESFFTGHPDEFRGKDLASVRDEIEKYLFEIEVNKQLKKHIEDLRSHSEIRIQLHLNWK